MPTKKIRHVLQFCLVVVLVMVSSPLPIQKGVAFDKGFITFENGVDGATIYSSIPGLVFTTTDGYPWIYGDWRTGKYNGPYPIGDYTSNGYFFAWLGPSQGDGRIDFTEGGASYFSVWVSCGETISLTGYSSIGIPLATTSVYPNVTTGQMSNMTITAPFGLKFSYVMIRGVGNYWLIDDLSTDADGVPDTRNPIVFLPGVAGSSLENDPNLDGIYDEVWPNTPSLVSSMSDDFLNVLRLDKDGNTPALNIPGYTTVKVGHVLEREVKDVYESTIKFFTSQTQGYELGKDFILCPYDWRKDLEHIAYGNPKYPGEPSLEKCINLALALNPDSEKVNILAHSMGGLVSRYYVTDPTKAQKIDKLITLGSPLLGAPKITLGVIDKLCFIEPGGVCLSNPQLLHELIQNFPPGYQISPGEEYFTVYPDGYYRLDWDKNGDGVDDGWLAQEQIVKILQSHNAELADRAIKVHDLVGPWSNGGTNGVQVYSIVGDGFDTLGGIREDYQKPWWNPWAKETLVISPIMIDKGGDGTVPLRSADTRNPVYGIDLSGDATIYYFRYDHGGLPQKPDVLQLASAIFANPTQKIDRALSNSTAGEISSGGILNSYDGITGSKTSTFELPRTEPLPLSVRRFQMYGPVLAEVYNSSGDRTGWLDHGGWENNIPGAVYMKIGDMTLISLPEDDIYTLNIIGFAEGDTDLRVFTLADDLLIQTDLYKNVPITGGMTATLLYDPYAEAPSALGLDIDSDGILDGEFPVTAVLDPAGSTDTSAPKTTIHLEGRRAGNGWYTGTVTVTMDAIDNPGGTGVDKIRYTIDGGQTENIYAGPFTVDAGLVTTILARAVDLAGNDEAPMARASVGPWRLMLPFMTK